MIHNNIIGRIGYKLSYPIGRDFCFESADTLQNGTTISCPLANTPSPLPHFTMTVTRTMTSGASEILLTRQTMNLLLNSSLLTMLFEDNTSGFTVACTVSNSFDTDVKMTSIRVCGMCQHVTLNFF